MFQSIYDGSLATRGPWEALVTFQQMLILCDRAGVVDMTADVISRRTIIPLEIITKGIEVLEQPDPESRRGAEEGRRIIRLDPDRSWGWQIVNYAHYRAIRTAEERREYMKTFMAAKRAKEREAEGKPPPPRKKAASKPLAPPNGFDQFWAIYPRKVAKSAAERVWLKIAPDVQQTLLICSAVVQHAKSEAWTKDGGAFIPHAATWLNGRRWEDDLSTLPQAKLHDSERRNADGSLKVAI